MSGAAVAGEAMTDEAVAGEAMTDEDVTDEGVTDEDVIMLENRRFRAGVLPARGGCLAEFAFLDGGTWKPLLRAAPRPWWNLDPVDSACFPLVPWSNRVSNGGFETPSGWVDLRPNRADEPYPIHGDGWLLPWEVELGPAQPAADRVTLALERRSAAPHAYHATFEYALTDAGLRMRLAVTHRGDTVMPYGLGFHPWFPYAPDMKLRAAADGMWLEKPDHLPGALTGVPGDLRLAGDGVLPDRWINNGFRGWDGVAEMVWPSRLDTNGHARHLELRCRGTSYFVLYHPPGADFVCFEPVTHPVDAFHLPPPHRGDGLRLLAPGDTLEVDCELTLVSA